MTLECPDCGAPMELGTDHFGKRFLCTRRPACGGTHGCHPDGTPMGIPADAATRRARSLAHACFDRLWQEGHMSRTEAYRWMQSRMGLSAEDAHISRLGTAACRTLVSRLEADFPDVFPFAS